MKRRELERLEAEAFAGDSEPARHIGRLMLLAGYYGPPEGGPSTVRQIRPAELEEPVRLHSQAQEAPVPVPAAPRAPKDGTLGARILAVLPTEAPGFSSRKIWQLVGGGGAIASLPSVCATLSHLRGVERTGQWRSFRYYKAAK